MRNPVLVGAALAASTVILLAGGSIALAQETGPGTQACADAIKAKDDAQAELRKAENADKDLKDAEQKLRNRNIPQDKWDNSGLRADLRELRKQGDIPDPASVDYWGGDKTGSDENTTADRDLQALQDWTQAKNDANDVKNSKMDDLRRDARDAERKADDVCGTVSTTPTTPAPPVFIDLNCGNFPLSDGTTAQQVLDQDRTDPHGLDADSNGIACDVTSTEPVPAPPVDNGRGVGNVTTPSGGVPTGGGPE